MKNFVLYCSIIIFLEVGAFEIPSTRWAREVLSDWRGRWFPNAPGTEDTNPEIEFDPYKGVDDYEEEEDDDHPCDNAMFNLKDDWDTSSINYTCLQNKQNFLPNLDVHPILHCDHIPVQYRAEHICMGTPINYEDLVPTFGPHRYLWAKYGEYLFLPKQRWLHNLEHGAVVMLYHPCANKNEVMLLKHLVQKCLYRHIITPYTLLPPDRPLALVTWGCRFMMSKVDIKLVVEFIKNTALHGPEVVSKNGKYGFGLLNPAEIVSDVDDKVICPNVF